MQPSIEVQPAPNRFRDGIFLFTLVSAALNGSWLSMAHLAWLVLAILFALDIRYAFYSIFFFASFFHPSGFLKDLPFSLKHLHIAFFLLIVIQMLEKKFTTALKTGFKENVYFYPLWAIAGIALMAALIRHGEAKTLFLTANFISILFMFNYLYGAMKEFPGLVKSALLFFLFGAALQCLIAFANFLTGRYWWNIVLIHNNHLGVLSAVSLFYGMAYAFSEKSKVRVAAASACSAIIFLSLIFSCSRTAWLSFAGGYLFLVVTQKFYSRRAARSTAWLKFLAAAVVLWGGFLMAGHANQAVKERVDQVVGLKEMNAWKYSLIIDRQNSGFLGNLRRNQVRQFKKIMKDHFAIGLGFTHQITDFHSLYLTILAATGIMGFALFVFFWFQIFRDLHFSLRSASPADFLYKTGSFAAMVTWLLVSGLENRLLQYPVWTNLFMALLFLKLAQNKNPAVFPEARQKTGEAALLDKV